MSTLKLIEVEIMMEIVKAEGGGTFLRNGRPYRPHSGFAVGTVPGSFAVSPVEYTEFIHEAVNDLLARYKNAMIGLWISEGKVYIDPVRHFYKESLAKRVGKDLKQQAIYNFANGETIWL